MTFADPLLIKSPELIKDEEDLTKSVYGVLILLYIICILSNIHIMEITNILY